MNISKKLLLLLCISFFSIFSITSFAQTVGQSGNVVHRKITGNYTIDPKSLSMMQSWNPKHDTFNDGTFNFYYSAFNGEGTSKFKIWVGNSNGYYVSCVIEATSTKRNNTWKNTFKVKNKPGWSCNVTPSEGNDPNFTPTINVVKL